MRVLASLLASWGAFYGKLVLDGSEDIGYASSIGIEAILHDVFSRG